MNGKEIQERTEKTIAQIKFAFFGAACNFYLLEEKLAQMENIPLYQFSNYLSQLAFCIELGLKSIIINKDGFKKEHEIENLFSMTPQAFQDEFREKYTDEKVFDANMSNMKNIFRDFRYMELDSNLKKYLDKSMLNNDKTINFKMAINHPNVDFLQTFLDGILEYEKFMWEKYSEQQSNMDCSDPDYVIKQYAESIKYIQTIMDMPQQKELRPDHSGLRGGVAD
jgi:hypothetical protein